MRFLKKIFYIFIFIFSHRCSNESLIPRFSLVVRIARKLLPEYRFIEPLLSWQSDWSFNVYLKKFGERHGYNDYRRFAVKELLKLSANIDGDTAEIGCYTGATSYLILQQNSTANVHPVEQIKFKQHLVFDSFRGLSTPNHFDGNHWQVGQFSTDEATLRRNLQEFSGKFIVYAGWVPSRFGEVSDRRFSFVHIDVDLYEPTLASLEFFYDRMNEGGILILDDYGFQNNPGVNLAADSFFKFRPEPLISLPTGAAFMIKI